VKMNKFERCAYVAILGVGGLLWAFIIIKAMENMIRSISGVQ
jgi:hypothetical protein